MLGYKHVRLFTSFVATKNAIVLLQDWPTCSKDEVSNYVGSIHDAFDRNLGVAILRLTTPADVSNAMHELVRSACDIRNELHHVQSVGDLDLLDAFQLAKEQLERQESEKVNNDSKNDSVKNVKGVLTKMHA